MNREKVQIVKDAKKEVIRLCQKIETHDEKTDVFRWSLADKLQILKKEMKCQEYKDFIKTLPVGASYCSHLLCALAIKNEMVNRVGTTYALPTSPSAMYDLRIISYIKTKKYNFEAMEKIVAYLHENAMKPTQNNIRDAKKQLFSALEKPVTVSPVASMMKQAKKLKTVADVDSAIAALVERKKTLQAASKAPGVSTTGADTTTPASTAPKVPAKPVTAAKKAGRKKKADIVGVPPASTTSTASAVVPTSTVPPLSVAPPPVVPGMTI